MYLLNFGSDARGELDRRPPRDLEYARNYNARFGEIVVHRFVDKIEVAGLENFAGLDRSRPYVYLANHQTVGDLFLPFKKILDYGLPMPRVVAKQELRAVKPIFDFSKFGVIWLDRGAKGSAALEDFTSLIAQGFRENESAWFFLEGTRSRTIDRAPAEFKAGSCGVILNAAKQSEPGVICVAMKYDAIPEGCLRNSTVRRFFPEKCVPVAELAYWMFLKRGKGTVRVAFSRPYEIEELAGSGRDSVRRKKMAEATHGIVSDMWHQLGGQAGRLNY